MAIRTIDAVTTWGGETVLPHAAAATERPSEAEAASRERSTILVPVDAMTDPERAPLRVLERALGRSLDLRTGRFGGVPSTSAR
jgi:hypothetical protein